MKLNKLMMVGLGLITCISALSAQTRLNITGSSAFRSATIKAIADKMVAENAATFKCVINGTSASLSSAQGAQNVAFRGPLGGHDTIVKATWTGAVDGVKDVVDQTNVIFINDAKLNAAPLGYSLAVAGDVNSPEKAQIAMADGEQEAHYPGSAPLAGGPVAVIPFQFAVSAAAPAALTNIDSNKAQANWTSGFPAGTQPAVLYTGNPADASKIVYAAGRDNGSGTRMSFVTETGIGNVNSVVNQYSIAATPTFIGNAGENSGGTLADKMKSANAQLKAYITYLGIGDARRAAGTDGSAIPSGGAPARLLTYNGQAFSLNNVQQGSYSFWNYENLLNAPLTPFQADAASAINSELLIQPTDSNGRWINLDDMLAGRNGSGQPVVR